MEDLRAQAIHEAMLEAEVDRDFLRQLCCVYVDGLSQEEINAYLGLDEA